MTLCGRTLLTLFALSLALGACTGFPFLQHGKKGKAIKPKPVYQAADFVEHVTLARLSLAEGSSPSAHLEAIDAYAQKKQKAKSVRQPVVILEYKTGKGAMQKIVAPISGGDKATEFPALLEIMHALETGTLHEIHPAVTLVTQPPKKPKLASAKKDEVTQAIEQHHVALLANAEKLPPLANVRTQMRLVRFFMSYRLRDAAYLSLEDAKQSLAIAARSGETETLKQVSQELEALESELRKTLPFTL